MVRATNTKASARQTRPMVGEDAPRRKPGRPPGSTNIKKVAATSSVKAIKPQPKRTSAPRSAARAPKPNKAELELQVGKLDRSVARLREKNKELKLAMAAMLDQMDGLEARLMTQPDADVAKPARRNARAAALSDPGETPAQS